MDRREFLKLTGLAALAAMQPKWFASQPLRQAPDGSPNVLIFLFDAMSARHLTLTGYPRATTPNLNRFIETATVYHNHYSAAPYTTPSVASLLTGTQVLTHRSFRLGERTRKFFTEANLFSLFDQLGYYTIAYTHNPMSDVLLKQFQRSLQTYKPREDLYLIRSPLMARLAANDYNAALQANQRIFHPEQPPANSLFISQILALLKNVDSPHVAAFKEQFPEGLPALQGEDIYFVLEEAIDWIAQALRETPTPMLGFFHLYPPHAPYRPRQEFYHRFRQDGFTPPAKPRHLFATSITDAELHELQMKYDEYFLYVDSEFNRLVNMLEDEGLLENSWIVFTSDHGDLFERGILGHTSLTLYEPVIHIPLFIKAPGQKERQDVYQVTSEIDVLPTLQNIAGKQQADWIEGQLLPPFGEQAEHDARPVITFNPRLSSSEKKLENGVFTIIKWPYKLIYYFGYEELEGQPLFELYDVESDPEELQDLATMESGLVTQLFDELRVYIDEHDVPA